MNFSFGRHRFSVCRISKLASRRLYIFGVDVAKITSLVEMAKEDGVGGPIYYIGLGRWAFGYQKFDLNYVPKYWEEDQERIRKHRESLLDMFPSATPSPQEKADEKVIKFPGKAEQDKVK